MGSLRIAVVLAALVLPAVPVGAEPSVPPPAAPAPGFAPVEDLSVELARLQGEAEDARRRLDEADAAVARAGREPRGAAQLERLVGRRADAERALQAVRERAPGLLARARAAGVDATTLHSYERALLAEERR